MELSKTDRDILEYLARNREATKWTLTKQTERAYSGIHRSIKKLLDYRQIELLRVENSSRNRDIEIQVYGLTAFGLYNALLLKDTWRDLDAVAMTHVEKLPLIFGKWSLYKENDVLEIVIRRLINGVIAAYPTLSRVTPEQYASIHSEDSRRRVDVMNLLGVDCEGFRKNRMEILSDFKMALTDSVLGIDHVFGDDEMYEYNQEQDKIIGVVRGDDDLRRYFELETEDRIKSHDRTIEKLRGGLMKMDAMNG